MLDAKLLVLRWRRALEIALPIAISLDAMHNAWIMWGLWRARLQVQTGAAHAWKFYVLKFPPCSLAVAD